MRIQDGLLALAEMEADGVVDRYAIGGAVGATFCLEPVATLDVDVFVTFPAEAGSLLVSPKAVFEYLMQHGATMEGEYVMISGWPLRFLPSTGPLVDEALDRAGRGRRGANIHRRAPCGHCIADRTGEGQGADQAIRAAISR